MCPRKGDVSPQQSWSVLANQPQHRRERARGCGRYSAVHRVAATATGRLPVGPARTRRGKGGLAQVASAVRVHQCAQFDRSAQLPAGCGACQAVALALRHPKHLQRGLRNTAESKLSKNTIAWLPNEAATHRKMIDTYCVDWPLPTRATVVELAAASRHHTVHLGVRTAHTKKMRNSAHTRSEQGAEQH